MRGVEDVFGIQRSGSADSMAFFHGIAWRPCVALAIHSLPFQRSEKFDSRVRPSIAPFSCVVSDTSYVGTNKGKGSILEF